MLWIDVKYAGLLSVQLENFSVKTNNPYLANFRCPVCGDSRKNKNKRRGYLYQKAAGLFYKCHNCGLGTTFGKLCAQVNPSLKDQYELERFKEKGHLGQVTPEPVTNFTPKFRKNKTILEDLFEPVDSSDECKEYLINRGIPEKIWPRLYFCDDSQKLVGLHNSMEGRIKGHEPRLVIPAFNRKHQLTGVTARAIQPNGLRYITVRILEDEPLIFGLDRIDPTDPVYITEGPIDSFFIENCIAAGSADLKKISGIIDKKNLVLVFDNQPRNKEVINIIEASINDDFNVVIWPEYITQKDINEMIVQGAVTSSEITEVLNRSTYNGLQAKLQFTTWRKLK